MGSVFNRTSSFLFRTSELLGGKKGAFAKAFDESVIPSRFPFAAFRILRVEAFCEEIPEKLIVTVFAAAAQGVVTRVVLAADVTKIRTAKALHEEESDRPADRIWAAGTFFQEGSPWKGEQFPGFGVSGGHEQGKKHEERKGKGSVHRKFCLGAPLLDWLYDLSTFRDKLVPVVEAIATETRAELQFAVEGTGQAE